MNNTKSSLTTNCPTCKTSLVWSSDNPNRPFCSESCRNKDFIAWSEEENRLAGSSTYDDLLSGELSLKDF
jgi:endogenous inhibitor of DNA gyrase (YacG/DUF329 family)